MALVNNPFLEGARGRIGDLVFFSRNGKTFVKPFQKNRRTNSLALKTHQERFKITMQFLRPIRYFLHKLNNGAARGNAQFNKIFSENLRNAIDGIYPDLSINFSKLLITKGELANGSDMTVSSPARGKLVVSWKNKKRQVRAKAVDDAFLACYDEETDRWIFKTELAKRKTGTCSLDERSLQGKSVYVYFGFVSQIKMSCSDSRYLGLVKVL